MKKNILLKMSGCYRLSLLMAACCLLNSCIENDVPYPYLVGQITGITVDGMSGNPQIQNNNRTVSIEVNDQVDIQALRITRLQVTNDASVFPDTLKCLNVEAFPEKGFPSLDSVPSSADTRIDFSAPVHIMLKTYQDYLWTVSVTQVFNRSIKLSKQVGDAVFDVKNKQAVVYVTEDQSLKNITVESMQLGSSIAVTTPEPTEVKDFSRPVIFEVKAFGRTEKWTVNVLYTDNTSSDISVFPRTKQAIVSGGIQSGASVAVEYKEKNAAQWIELATANVNVDGTNFTADITGLTPATAHQCRANINGAAGATLDFTTASAEMITNGSFDEWSQDAAKPKLWYPWADGGTSFWDTGNKGATLVGGDSNSMPTEETCNGKGRAAKLESKYVLVKFAAGNIFSGSYLRTDVTDGVLSFGRPFSSFPTKLKIHYKYNPKPIDKTSASYGDYAHLLGRPDSCFIYLALTDWDAPLEIRTRPANRQLFDKNDKNVIAYTELISGTESSSYQEVELPITYRYTNRTPKYMVLVATSSKYGDYFTGGEGSTLWIDDFELIYE
ncbi:PCMD domain-containing protein [Parabacteroides faecis]|uniref:PCMD domain-containing protein n=1 Tax=Parabacteroides faecis TaxID=1217282 RepID=UPI003520CD66